MEDLDSVFIYQQEKEQDLRQKLMNATLELETMKNVKTELSNLLKMAYQERDEAKCQLQKLMNKLDPSSPINLQDVFVSGGVNHESFLMFPSTKTNPRSITESSSLSHGSPPVDSFFDTVSSPEFSNLNNKVDSDNINNKGCLNQQHLFQDFNCLPMPDPAAAVIDCLARERAWPQKGKLLQAVIDAGPLLQTILLAGPLPTWRNPPPLQDIKVPPLTIKEYDDTTSIEPKPSLLLQSSNVSSTCSPSMLNFAGHPPPSSWNNSWQFSSSSSSSVRIQVHSRKRQRHQ